MTWLAQWFLKKGLIGSEISIEGPDWLSFPQESALDGIVWRAIGSCRFQFQLSWTISSFWTLGSHLRSERLAPQPTATISYHQNLSRLLFSAVSVLQSIGFVAFHILGTPLSVPSMCSSLSHHLPWLYLPLCNIAKSERRAYDLSAETPWPPYLPVPSIRLPNHTLSPSCSLKTTCFQCS